MKVLILSLTVGQGHNSTSKALAEYMQAHGATCRILDTYKFLNKLVGETLDKGYTAIGRFSPKLNDSLYQQAGKVNGKPMMKRYLPFAFAKMTKDKMKAYVDGYDPDVIVCPHIFSAIIITEMKKDHMIRPGVKTYGIVTDFTLHPFWEYTQMDYFITASELMNFEVVRRGIPEEKILPFGIPVRECFNEKEDMQEVRARLGLKDMLTLLVVGGGMGFGDIPGMVEDLEKMEMAAQIVVICGSNSRLKIKLEKYKAGLKNSNKELVVLGYTTNINEYMDAADLLITKPGGLSISEALAKGKTMILMEPLPGVETFNLYFLLNNSLAVHVNRNVKASDVVLQLWTNELKHHEMEQAVQKWGKRHSAKRVGDFIFSQFEQSKIQ